MQISVAKKATHLLSLYKHFGESDGQKNQDILVRYQRVHTPFFLHLEIFITFCS